MITKKSVQYYISNIYKENKTILFTTSTGFGKYLHYFRKPLLEDLLESKKYCLIICPLLQIIDHLQENFFNEIKEKLGTNLYDIIKNRTKFSVEFKNGSLIEFKTLQKMKEYTYNNKEESDILYIDSISRYPRNNIQSISYLLSSFKKVIIIDDEIKRFDNNSEQLIEQLKLRHPFYSFHMNLISDLIIEFRKLKLKQLRKKCKFMI